MQLSESQRALARAILALEPHQVLIVARRRTIPRTRTGFTTTLLYTLAERSVQYFAESKAAARNVLNMYMKDFLPDQSQIVQQRESLLEILLPDGRRIRWSSGVLGERGYGIKSDLSVIEVNDLLHALPHIPPILRISGATIITTEYDDPNEFDRIVTPPPTSFSISVTFIDCPS